VDPWERAGLEGALVRVLAHELGHLLGLAHVPCIAAGNLMSAGCDSENRTRLTDVQIEVAREQAASGRPFRGSTLPSGAIAFLLAHEQDLQLNARQRAYFQEMDEAYTAAVAPLRESSRLLSQEGMRQMRSGVSDPSAARERQRRMQEIMREIGAVERQMLDLALVTLHAEQSEVAQRLLERRAVMMVGGG